MLDKLTMSDFRRATWRGVIRYLGFRRVADCTARTAATAIPLLKG